MSKTEPIQGPLIVRRGQGTVPHYVIVDRDSRLGIAHVFDFGIENAKTSALLFAAAPDLLQACKLLQAALTEYNLRDVKKRYSLCVADAAANKAIAKAESGASNDS